MDIELMDISKLIKEFEEMAGGFQIELEPLDISELIIDIEINS